MFNKWVLILFFSCPIFSDMMILEDIQEAKKQAAFYEKPLVLLFMGTDWCGHCRNLEQNVLTNPQFAKSIENFFIFCKIEIGGEADKKTALEHEQLVSEYIVEAFPTLVILDAKGRCIYKESGNRGYQPYEYGEHLKKKYLEKIQVLVKWKSDQSFEGLALIG